MPVISTIPIMLDKERHLLYTWTSFMKAELELTKQKGVSTTALEVFRNMTSMTSADAEGNAVIDFTKVSMTDLLILVWAGLLHEDPKLSLEKVGDNLLFADLSRVLMAVSEAISSSLPKEDASEAPLVQMPPDEK